MTNALKIYGLSFSALLALMFLLAPDIPRLFGVAPAAIGILFTALYPLAFRARPMFSKQLFITVGGICALALVSTLWASAPDESLSRAMKMSLVLLSSALLVNLALFVPLETLKPYLRFIPVAIAIAAFIIAAELILQAPLYRLMRGMAEDVRVPKAVFNRGTVCAVLCFFPAFALAQYYFKPRAAAIFMIAPFALMMMTIDSQSAQLALIIGALTLAFFPVTKSWAWYALTAIITILIFAAPFVAMWAYEHLSSDMNDLPFFGRGAGFAGGRLEIWDFVSRYAMTNPLTGFGFEVTRTIDDFDSAQIFTEGTSALHPHNFAIQLWIEFGAIGAAAGSALIASLLLGMKKYFTAAQNAIALPTFMAVLSVSATGYGIWQSWWLGLLCVTAALVILSARVIKTKESA